VRSDAVPQCVPQAWPAANERGHTAPESARRAVLRSEGHCENPRCTGEPQDITDAGHPILEVDHIQDLANGGPDHPEQMIALCPNCHEIKTRGRTRERLRHELFTVARRRHEAILSR
jgi:5-methylcytosine-specific restriction protein A